MVDFQRNDRNKISKLEQIITNLKQQSEHNQDDNDNNPGNQLIENKSCGNKNNSKDILSWLSKVGKKIKSDSENTQSNITDYFTVVKTVPVTSSTRDATSWNVLHTLKTNKESSLVTSFDEKGSKNNIADTLTDINSYQIQSFSSNTKFDTNLNKSSSCNIVNNIVINGENESDKRQLNTSTEVIRKTHNYHKRRNNKRLKIYNDANQSAVTDFFNLAHKARSNKPENITTSVAKVEKTFSGNTTFDILNGSTIENEKTCKLTGNPQVPTNRKPVVESPSEKVCSTNFLQGNDLKSNEKNEKLLNILKNLRTKDERDNTKSVDGNKNILNNKKHHLQNSDVDVRRKFVFQNKEKHAQTEQNKMNFDDFCNNLATIIGQNSNVKKKMEIEKDKQPQQLSHPASNFFPKSHSTGVLIVKSSRNSCKDISSLPVTELEIKSRKEKLAQGKISFDDFTQNILKELCSSEPDKKDCESNIESMHNSEEKSNSNNEYKTNDIESLIENLKNDKAQNSTVKNRESNKESIYSSEETDDVNNECKKKNIKDLIADIKNDEQVDSTVTNHDSKLNLTKCSKEKLYQSDHENITQESNSIDREFFIIKTKSNLENLQLYSTTYSETCRDNVNRDENDLKYNINLSLRTETKESESEDFLSYFPINHQSLTESAQVLAEPDNLTDKNYSKHNDDTFLSLERFPANICRDISLEIHEDGPNIEVSKLINEEKINYADSCNTRTWEYTNFTESNTHYIDSNNQKEENASEQEPFDNVWKDNLLENNLINVLLSESDQVKSDTKQSEHNKSKKWDDFLEKLLEQNNLRRTNRDENKVAPRRTYIKRFRKGKTKIYRLKKLKKICPNSEIAEAAYDENLKFDDVFKKITQGVGTTKDSCLTKSKSMSSVSTSSSYVTDVTQSEILSTGSNELSSPKQRLRKGFNELSKDKSLLYCEEEWENTTEYDKEEVKMKIQDIILKVVHDFSEKNSSSLKYRRQSFDNCIVKDGRLQLKPMVESSMTVINSKAQRSQSKFTLICYLLKKIQKLLETDTKLTKRELYYQLKTLIRDQRVTDRAINAISCLLNVGMWALNIIAQKGLVFGNLKILMSSGETLNCNIPGTLIPQDINDIVEIASPAYFILVVEKESIFYKLIEEDLPNRLTRPFIMITGKGFPDLNTQLFLRKLWMIMSIPVFILVDADPHGINIMLNYRFGSVNNAHVSHQLAVPNAKWLGVYPSEVINLNIMRELLSERELKLVNQLLKTPYMDCNPRIVDELKILLETKSKAEIEGLIKSDTYLSEVYLPNKFFTHNFI